MFKTKFADRLDEEQYTTAIGENDEEFQLRPMHPLTRPTMKEAFETISLMKNTQDWKNIIPFLSGLKLSKRVVKDDRWEWIIRHATEANALGIMLEAAKQADRTGFKLSSVGIVRRYYLELHRWAAKNKFSEPTVSKAFGFAKQAAESMEWPQHVVRDPQVDPKRRPFVVGTLLELSAARALKQFDGKDEGGLVATYANRLQGVWSLVDTSKDASDWPAADLRLQEIVPILNGIDLALQIKEIADHNTIGGWLKQEKAKLKGIIQSLTAKAPENVKEKPTIGYQQAVSLRVK